MIANMKFLFAFLLMAQTAFANPQELRPLDANEILHLPRHVDVMVLGEPASYSPNSDVYRNQLKQAKAYLHAAEHLKKVWADRCKRIMHLAVAQIYPPMPEARRIKFRQVLCYEMGFLEPFPPKGQSDFQPPY